MNKEALYVNVLIGMLHLAQKSLNLKNQQLI